MWQPGLRVDVLAFPKSHEVAHRRVIIDAGPDTGHAIVVTPIFESPFHHAERDFHQDGGRHIRHRNFSDANNIFRICRLGPRNAHFSSPVVVMTLCENPSSPLSNATPRILFTRWSRKFG